MNPGKLNKRIELLANDSSKDGQGGKKSNWITECNLWAKVDVPKTSREAIQGGYVAVLTYNIMIREYKGGYLDGKRIRYKNNILKITSSYDDEETHMTYIQCREMTGRH